MSQKNILIVDDNQTFRKTLSDCLRVKGYATRESSTGKSALDLMAKETFSLAIIDLQLPDIEGLDMMREGKNISPETEFIVLTGHASLPTAIEAVNIGAYSYLQKPCQMEQILFALKRALEKQETLKNLRLSELKMALAIESSDAGYFEHDRDFSTGAVSGRWASILGFRKEDMPPVHELFRWWLERLHPEDRPAMLKSYDQLMEGRSNGFHIESRVRNKNDDWRWLKLTTRIAESDRNGKPISIVGLQTDITEQKEAQAKLAFMATHDELTGLPNRTLFLDRLKLALSRVQRTRKKLAVLFLDLDKFKDVNDTLGHSIGDRLIKMVADQLLICLRKSDTVARLGGDEFMLLLPEINLERDVECVASKIIDMIQIPFSMDHIVLRVTASVGVAVYPHDGEDAETIVKNADVAMYHAKEAGRNAFVRFKPAMTQGFSDSRLWKRDHANKEG